MASYRIKVPNNDEGEDLGKFEADYLPRIGDRIAISHPRLCAKRGDSFIGVVESVWHDAGMYETHARGRVDTTVWVVEEQAAPTLYCDCSDADRAKYGKNATTLACDNCGHARRAGE